MSFARAVVAAFAVVAPLAIKRERSAVLFRHEWTTSSNRMLAQVHIGEHAGLVGAALGS